MPFDVETRDGLIVVTLDGEITFEDLTSCARAIDAIERHQPGLHRLVITTGVTGTPLSYNTMTAYAADRRGLRLAQEVRVAIVANSPVTFGLARMFQALLNHPSASVAVFTSCDEATSWLLHGQPPRDISLND
jgi:hypothetical protein